MNRWRRSGVVVFGWKIRNHKPFTQGSQHKIIYAHRIHDFKRRWCQWSFQNDTLGNQFTQVCSLLSRVSEWKTVWIYTYFVWCRRRMTELWLPSAIKYLPMLSTVQNYWHPVRVRENQIRTKKITQKFLGIVTKLQTHKFNAKIINSTLSLEWNLLLFFFYLCFAC